MVLPLGLGWSEWFFCGLGVLRLGFLNNCDGKSCRLIGIVILVEVVFSVLSRRAEAEVRVMNGSMSVTNKSTHEEVSVSGNEFSLHSPSVVQLATKRSDIKSIERQGDMLVVTLASGALVKIHAFFPAQGPQLNDLVIKDGAQLWQVGFSENGQIAGQYVSIDSIDPLLINDSFDLSTLAWVVGGVALAAAAGGGGGR